MPERRAKRVPTAESVCVQIVFWATVAWVLFALYVAVAQP